MNILLWHGYLLSGSGSNVYTANVARVWREQGHDVLLLCQDRHADELPFVDEYGEFAPENDRFACHPTDADQAPGRLRVVRPAIGELLPVYVWDPYEGFTARRFVDLTDEQLEHYVATNVDALEAAVRVHRPEAVVIGHEVMGPYIGRLARERTGVPYSVKLHGSALEYAVKVQERYVGYARDGFAAADTIVGTSRYLRDTAAAVVPGDWVDRSTVVNPGCDVETFSPREREPAAPPTVGFVGKLITAKGPQNLLAALGRTGAPDLGAVVVGYGESEDMLHRLHDALVTGDVDAAESLLADDPHAVRCRAFLESKDVTPDYLARVAAVPVRWTGRLDHDRLVDVLPSFDLLVVPSEVPEAFGMVAAEAAAAGVIPVVPRHSGIGEIGVACEEAIDMPGLLTYDPDDSVRGIADRIDALFALTGAKRAGIETALVKLAHDRWCWQRVADNLLSACAAGR
ncbi:MAG: glycosyltransferase family 4 protein [Streptosporangiales bacterium]